MVPEDTRHVGCVPVFYQKLLRRDLSPLRASRNRLPGWAALGWRIGGSGRPQDQSTFKGCPRDPIVITGLVPEIGFTRFRLLIKNAATAGFQ
ncbi:hypothetical protein C7450_104268 [Chelatococcus asaccharovorans]|uniref:Uncharacterized protein n=1 Tax=Chelatococcus asaccharovorans TaxID=28210 RepID=A0A2V3U8S8_9HYPH|nr:hypothetical protein C7450_104268 [Chelatococcus asaccharovorans]